MKRQESTDRIYVHMIWNSGEDEPKISIEGMEDAVIYLTDNLQSIKDIMLKQIDHHSFCKGKDYHAVFKRSFDNIGNFELIKIETFP